MRFNHKFDNSEEIQSIKTKVRAFIGQAKDLRAFLKGMGFPTQLLAKGTPAAIVMKICGWRDLKTMEFYIRVAGVDENVVSLFGFRE